MATSCFFLSESLRRGRSDLSANCLVNVLVRDRRISELLAASHIMSSSDELPLSMIEAVFCAVHQEPRRRPRSPSYPKLELLL